MNGKTPKLMQINSSKALSKSGVYMLGFYASVGG
jgi:hypothetical protein